MSQSIKIKGEYNTGVVFNLEVDEASYQQVQAMMSEPEYAASKFRFMPDIHYGKGSTVGTTMTITDKVTPSFIGVDIGCGVSVTRLDLHRNDAAQKDFLKRFDRQVKQQIPRGFNKYQAHQPADLVKHTDFIIKDLLDENTFYQSIGTLGGGNHFISLEVSQRGDLHLLIHTGSRKVGHTVATTYQGYADRPNKENAGPKGVLTGQLFEDYLHDLQKAQQYALQNRRHIRDTILVALNLNMLDHFDTVHNYIELETKIARKGAVSAQKGERLVIPFNSRDGSVIAVGKGNPDWNYSAPHGAGRTMSRHQARKHVSLVDYHQMMSGIYSSTVSKQTLDEAPPAYKDYQTILKLSEPTLDVLDYLTPIYNLKG